MADPKTDKKPAKTPPQRVAGYMDKIMDAATRAKLVVRKDAAFSAEVRADLSAILDAAERIEAALTA